MAGQFIDLDRKFNRVPTLEGDDKDLSDFSLLSGSQNKTWGQLLDYPRVIILAEAGAGKTEEIRHQAQKLKNLGKYSFFLRIEYIHNNFELAFEPEGCDKEQFKEWLASEDKAYFFLDSVDEAKLKSERDFTSAIKSFKNAIGKALQRTQLFITSRASAWRATTDLNFVNRELCNKSESDSKDELEKQFKVYSLENFSTDEIKTFSSKFGIKDTDDFVIQLKEREVEGFANRPLDLIDLVKFRITHQRIGSRLELVQYSITTKLRIDKADRELANLSPAKLMEGAEEIAAAMVFCKQSNVANMGCEQSEDVLNVEEILNDWTPQEVETLLSRPIFELSKYGTSRFNHRIIREYLAAQWIKKRVDKKSISHAQLFELFYKNIYYVEVLIPSLKPILAWYVLLDRDFENTVISRSPEVFIDGGDSSQLPVETRKQLISKFCQLYSRKEQCYISFDSAAIKRFSSPEMGDLIRHLLTEYYSYKDLRQILLQIAGSSSMKECLEIALEMSLDSSVDPVSLTFALRIIKANSEPDFFSSHSLKVLNAIPKESDRLFSVVVSELGHVLPLGLFLRTITSLDMSEKRGFRDINYYIERFSEELDLENSIKALNFIYPLVDEKPYMNKFRCNISEKYEWLVGVLQRLLVNIIRHKRLGDISNQVLDSLSKASTYDKNSYHSDGKLNDKLRELVISWNELSYSLFWYEVGTSRARLKKEEEKTGRERPLNRWFQAGCFGKFWGFKYSDLDSVLGWIDSKELMDDRFVALSLAWEIVKEEGRKSSDEEKLDSVAVRLDGSVELLDNFRNPKKEDWEIEEEVRQKKYIEDQAREEEKSKKNAKEWVEHLNENLNYIDTLKLAPTGEINNAQLHLYSRLRNHSIDHNSYLVDDCSPLVEEFGEEIASRFSNFLVSYWKCFEDNILISEGSERNSTTYATIMALCGIEIENKSNPNWVDGISSKEATSATRLSLCELNNIPSWMSKVYEKYPDEVLSVYLACVEWCFKDTSDNDDASFILDKLVSSCDYLHNDIAPPIYQLLEKYTISKYRLQKQSIWLLSLSNSSDTRLTELAKFKLENESETKLVYMWWALYIATEPNGAIRLFERRLEVLPDNDATDLAINTLNCLNDKRGFGALTNREKHMNVANLHALYVLMHKYIREEDDIDRADGGVYSPTARDDAQDARNSLFSALKSIPGEESYNALRSIARMWVDKPWKESWIEHMAIERAATDGDSKPMSEKEFADYSEKTSKEESQKLEINVGGNLEMNNSAIGNEVNGINVTEVVKETTQTVPEKEWYETFYGKVFTGVAIGVLLIVIGWMINK